MIDRLHYKAGSLIDAGTLLTTLSDNREVFAYFSVSEREYLDFVSNVSDESRFREVSLILANNTKHPYRGKIETIEGEIDRATGSIAFRARFPNPDKILKHGATGKVHIVRQLKNVIMIPQKSTFELQDRLYLYVVDSTNMVHMRRIQTGERLPHLYVVKKGVTEKDRFIYEGIQEARDSAIIVPRFVPPHQIFAEMSKGNGSGGRH